VSLFDEDLSFSELAYLFHCNATPELFKKIVLYNESPSRMLDVFGKVNLEPHMFEGAILDVFTPDISYKVHLVILIPLLIDKPRLSLFNPKVYIWPRNSGDRKEWDMV